MPEKISAFRSPEGEAKYLKAYEAVIQQWPVPYDELTISTRYGETHVVASGARNAAPLVLLHPAGGGATIWVRNFQALSKHYRVYAVDTISETNKSVLTRRISHQQRNDFAEWMLDLLDNLSIERTAMACNSFGGFLTLSTVLLLPERVRKAVLISPAATFVPIPAWTWHFLPANMLGSKRMQLDAYKWIWQDFAIDESMAQLRAIYAIYGRARHWFPTVFSDEELHSVPTPMLLLIGDHEVSYKPEDAIRRATRLVPGLKAEIVPNANHIAEYTAADTVNAAILNFLEDERTGL